VVDVGRVSKDGLLSCALLGLMVFLPSKRSLSKLAVITLIYGLLIASFNRWAIHSVSVNFQALYLLIGAAFLAKYFMARNGEGEEYILNGMAIGCLIQSFLVLTKSCGVDIYGLALSLIYNQDFKFISNRATGSLGNPNLVASYIALTSIALFRGSWAVMIAFPIGALFITESLMGIGAMAAGAFYFINAKSDLIKKPILYSMLAFGMVGAYIVGLNGADTRRFLIWEEILKRTNGLSVLFGNGPGWLADHPIYLAKTRAIIQEHSEYVSLFNIFGLIGVALVLIFAIRFIKQKDQSVIFPSIVFAGAFNCYGHFTLHQSTTAIILLVSVAICFAQGSEYVSDLER
jgi:hypothetical protein